MADSILSSTTGAAEQTPRFNANDTFGDIAVMLANMDRNGRLTDNERDTLRAHAVNTLDALPLMIRGVAMTTFESLTFGGCDRNQIANALLSIDLMADAMQCMTILAGDLRSPCGVPNHA